VSMRSDMMSRAKTGVRLHRQDLSHTERFIRGCLNDDGGFVNRSGRSDLYYTVFGLSASVAMGAEVPWRRVAAYLSGFNPAELDLVHAASLARCWAHLPAELATPDATRQALGQRLLGFGAADGGNVYGCFLLLGALEDLGADVPEADRLIRCVESCRAADGGYANQPGQPVGSAPATAAAVRLLYALGRPVEPAAGEWLLGRCFSGDGFVVHPSAPVPDLLSTAVALHAMEAAGAALGEDRRRACEAFVLGLRHERGGFRGHWADEAADCEYTFYGLLALGHLSCGDAV